MINSEFNILEFESFLKYKEIEKLKEIKLNKFKRRYKQYLNEIYFEPFAIIGSNKNNYYKQKTIELIIKNKWLERKLKRIKNNLYLNNLIIIDEIKYLRREK